jgi:hypothetical protein
MASRPAGMGLRVGVVGSRGMFRGIVRCYSWHCSKWGPPASLLVPGDKEKKAHGEEDTSRTNSQLKSRAIDSIGGKRRPLLPRFLRHRNGRKKHLKGGGELPTNLPLWVNLNFKLGEVPSLVGTGSQFSCIRRDVMQTLNWTRRESEEGLMSVVVLLS